MTNLKRITLLLALGACLAAAGCGSDDEGGAPIPADAVQLLERRLVETENRLGDGSLGACEDILNDTRPEVARLLEALPDDVDPDVRDALEASFENLWSLVESTCQGRQPEEPAEPAPTPEPEETETETETTPETTMPETTPPEEEILPPEGDGDNDGAVPGNGNGNGNGNGGGFGPGGANKGRGK